MRGAHVLELSWADLEANEVTNASRLVILGAAGVTFEKELRRGRTP